MLMPNPRRYAGGNYCLLGYFLHTLYVFLLYIGFTWNFGNSNNGLLLDDLCYIYLCKNYYVSIILVLIAINKFNVHIICAIFILL